MKSIEQDNQKLEFCSLLEFTKKYFPEAHKRESDHSKHGKNLFGTGLTAELLDNVKNRSANC
jgi:hypothetical protein